MTFINRYIQRTSSPDYYYSEEFLEAGASVIFAVGKTEGKALITKIDTNGNVLWEKIWIYGKSNIELCFRKVIQIIPDKGAAKTSENLDVLYVLHADADGIHWLISIDTNGNQGWCKRVIWDDRDTHTFLEASKTDSSFFFVLSDKGQTDKTGSNPIMVQLDSTGTILSQQVLIVEDHVFIVNAVTAHAGGIVLAGRHAASPSQGLIVDFVGAVSVQNAVVHKIKYPHITIHNIQVSEQGQYLISGYENEHNQLFIATLTGKGGEQAWLTGIRDHNSSVRLGKDGFYLLAYNDIHGFVYHLDWSFAITWAKEIRIPEAAGNGVRYISVHPATGRFNFSAGEQHTHALIAYTEADMESCYTRQIAYNELTRIDFSIDILKLSVEDTRPVLQDNDQSAVQPLPINTRPTSQAAFQADSLKRNPFLKSTQLPVQDEDPSRLNVPLKSTQLTVRDNDLSTVNVSLKSTRLTLQDDSFTVDEGSPEKEKLCDDRCTTYLNQYSHKDTDRNYYYTEEFIESGRGFVYSIGKNASAMLISKADEYGDMVWEKLLYIRGEEEAVACRKIIKLYNTSGVERAKERINIVEDRYVVYATTGQRHYVVSIDGNGNVLWCQRIFWEDDDVIFHLAPCLNDRGFYVVLSNRNQIDAEAFPFIGRFDESGSLSISRMIYGESKELIIDAVRAHENGFTLGGRFIEEDSRGVILDLNADLEIKISLYVDNPYLAIHDIIVPYSGNYIFSGYYGKAASLFVTAVGDKKKNLLLLFPDTVNHASTLTARKDGFYFTQNSRGHAITHFFDRDFTIKWTKEIRFLAKESNGIQLLNYNEESRHLSTNAWSAGLSIIVHTNEDLDSCKTIRVGSPDLQQEEYSFREWASDVKEYKIKLKDVEVIAESVQTVKTIYCPCNDERNGVSVEITDTTSLQSPDFYLQATGSTAADGSAKGIHLRWVFAGTLGKKHLPKGDYATTSYNFNRPDDYVHIYRTPYVKVQINLDLHTKPDVVDNTNKVWIYRPGNKVFYVYFRNVIKYNQVRNSVDPLVDPLAFIQAYGSELLEIENKKALFFAAELTINKSANSNLRVESLSVPDNTFGAPKTTSSRKTYTSTNLPGIVRIVCENGRSVRFKAVHCTVASIQFEFYEDFVEAVNRKRGWKHINRFALTLSDLVAFERLEPMVGMIDNQWQRFNDHDYVNIENYRDKWNGSREPWDRNIRMVVEKYIDLSNDPSNPSATEVVPMDSGAGSADDSIELSHLDLLNIAAYDYHIARMLGLGTLDTSVPVMTGQFVYLAQYLTKGDLEDGEGQRPVFHLSMTLPTAITDQRLPLPVDLREIVPGAFWGIESGDPIALTDADGYSHDGSRRYVTLYIRDAPEDQTNQPFYSHSWEFSASDFTIPVYAGIEYRKNAETSWIRPELSNDPRYLNKADAGASPVYETRPLTIPEPQKPLFVHKQCISGIYTYSTYGINWFSRSVSSTVVLSVQTDLQAPNVLLPPSNINALLVRNESPLVLSSLEEQGRLQSIPAVQDRILIRLTFDYHTYHELLDYKISSGADISNPEVVPPDNKNVFADKIDIFFRNAVPEHISGKVISVADHPSNSLLAVLYTGNYFMSSVNQTLIPAITAADIPRYIGGVFSMGNQQYIIHEITLPSGAMQGPAFTVYKQEISAGIITNLIPAPGTVGLASPTIVGDGLFLVFENMQNVPSWGTSNPLSLKVNIGENWPIHHEIITLASDDSTQEYHLEKTRGIWDDNTLIEKVNEVVEQEDHSVVSQHNGLYKFTFNISLPQHSQYNNSDVSVEWYQGIIRVHTAMNPHGPRKMLNVWKVENIGIGNHLVVYAHDALFSNDVNYDQIQIGTRQVNFYPGYKVYLYADAAHSLTETTILPAEGEGVHYSIFGLRSHDEQENYYSKISVPQLMFAQEQKAAVPPEQPIGSLYATRPDFFGRSTYTFTTKYAHKPHGALFYRSNNEALLNALYEQSTVQVIKDHLKLLGGNDEPFLSNRWSNFLDLATLAVEGDYKTYPANNSARYKFPNPDKKALYDWANEILDSLGQPPITEPPGSLPVGNPKLINFVKGAVYNAFVPLTEIPVIFQYIKGGSYLPVAKKQVVRDKDGYVLNPSDPDFDMAPMMKLTGGTHNETLFTDFTLDGTSDNIYFYGVREVDTQMKMSDFSPFLGPVKLINTNPPEAPEVKRVMPVLEDKIRNILPAIQFEINAYPAIQKVQQVNIYRAYNKLDGQSVRSMKLVKTVDLDVEGSISDSVWIVQDTFEDLPEIPYNDGLYYRLTTSRRIEYADKSGNILIDYAPSQPSKMAASFIVEAYNPPAPIVKYISEPVTSQGDLHAVLLYWQKSAYKAKYHVYKMNSSGTWTKIHELQTNDDDIYLPLELTTLQTSSLPTKDADGGNIYHHFKVVAENTSGLLSIADNILTIPDSNNWIDIGGVGNMITDITFIVR